MPILFSGTNLLEESLSVSLQAFTSRKDAYKICSLVKICTHMYIHTTLGLLAMMRTSALNRGFSPSP